MKAFENRAGSRFPSGYNPQLRDKVMRLTLDPIKVTAHPLALYAFTNFTSWSVKQLMISRGFVEARCVNRSNGLLYLIRKPSGWDKLPVETRTLPFVFIHGLGIGQLLTLIIGFLLRCNRCDCVLTWSYTQVSFNIPVFSTTSRIPLGLDHGLSWSYYNLQSRTFRSLLPLTSLWSFQINILFSLFVSLSLFDSRHLQSPSKPEMMLDMTEALRQQNFDQTGFELLGHSNGTLIAAWLISSMPNLIKRVCLIDPVCFCKFDYYFHWKHYQWRDLTDEGLIWIFWTSLTLFYNFSRSLVRKNRLSYHIWC